MMNNTEKSIIDAIQQYNTFSIVPHINPDTDAIGSCYAVKRVLESMGKSATVYTQEELPKYLSFLGGEYRVYEKAEKHDVCMCIDCGDIGRVDKRTALIEAATVSINIDHHYANTGFADINLIDAKSCSSGEICCAIIRQLGVTIDSVTAMCLYSAICADTGGFRYSNTTAKTLRTAADLLEYGIDVAKINKVLFDTESHASIRLKGEIAKNIELYCDGLVGVVCLTQKMMDDYGISANDIDNIVNIARKVEDVEVAVSIKQCGQSAKVSLRSNEYIDVSKIAEQFGGGGHVRASGGVINGDFEEAKKKVIKEVIKIVKEYEK